MNSLAETAPWPLVLVNDGGIRPAGPADACFYCHAQVGSPHAADCVTVRRRNEYLVLDKLKQRCGLFVRADPHSWDTWQCEFHLNESSWCADNAVDEIVWDETECGRALQELVAAGTSCSCAHLIFEFSRIVEAGPFRST